MCGHTNDIPCLINEMDEFHNVLEYVYDYAEENGDILVVTVADHETGGLALGRGTSVNAMDIVSYITGDAPKDYDTTQYYGTFDYNYLIPYSWQYNLSINYGYAYIYDWFPESIEYTKHTSEWIANDILLNTSMVDENTDKSLYTSDEIIDIIETNYLGGNDPNRDKTIAPDMTEQERGLIQSCLKRDYYFEMPINGSITNEDDLNLYQQHWSPVLMHCIVMLMNARTLTGWTSHGHSGADVSLSCYGPGCDDNFNGHHTNAEIGRILTKLLQVGDEQEIVTNILENMFLNDSLTICDDTYNLGFYGYDHNVSYPSGNLKYVEMCVEEYVS